MNIRALTQNRKLQILVGFIVFSFLVFQAVRAYERRNEGFHITKIYSDFSYNQGFDIAVTKEEIELANVILSQPFHYFSHGFQCYAFESADGQYILKFIRHQRLRPSFMLNNLPNIPLLKQYKRRKKEELVRRAKYLFSGLKVGFESAREETALVFVHLNKTENVHPTIEITDKVGDRYQVNLNELEFVLQKKACHIKPVISNLMLEGKELEAKNRIDQIYTLLVGCAKKGIVDNDGALIRKNNLGFYQDHAIYIDTGKLAKKRELGNKERFIEDLKKLRPLQKWLLENYPRLAVYFEEKKKTVLDEF